MKYTSNAKEVISGLRQRLEEASGKKASSYDVNKVVRMVALQIYASNLRRIHNEGQSVGEVSIGKYSTKPTLVGASSFVNKGAAKKVFGKNKNKDLEWRTLERGGKQVRLAILEGGYKKIREIEGRETSHINLQRTGRLMKDYSVTTQGKDWLIGFASEYGSKLREGLEDHFGKIIWGVSRGEAKIADNIITFWAQQLNRPMQETPTIKT